MAKETAEQIAERRKQQPNSAGVSADQVDQQQLKEQEEEKKAQQTRMVNAQKNKTKMVKMRANTAIKLPKKTADELGIPRDVAPGDTVKVPGDIAEMFTTPVTGFFADEGGEWAGNNRPKHKVLRAEIVQ